MRRAARVDANHAEIAAALESIGCSVWDTSALGDGAPDLVAARHSCGNILFEIKDGKKPPSKRKLTPEQVKFHGRWNGPIVVVDSVESAIRAIVGLTR